MIAQMPEIEGNRGSGRREVSVAALTAEAVLAKYEQVDDFFTPTYAELQILFARYNGNLLRHRNQVSIYALEMPGKSLVGTREQIWKWYRQHREALEATRSTEPPF